MKLAKHFGKVAPGEENDIRTAFFVRLALSQLYGDADEGAKKLLHAAVALSPDTARKAIEALDCDEAWKEKMRDMVAGF